MNIPAVYITDDGIRLGRWICRQREAYYTTLSEERKQKLDSIGMVWEQPDPWEQKFALVRRYYEKHGDVKIPADYVMDGVWIARWLAEQIARLNGKNTGKNRTVKKLTEEQIKKLGSVGIKANTSRGDIAWEEQYAEAKRFYETHGHLTVPKGYVGQNGKSLDRWLQLQRTNSKHHKLSDERMVRLNEIGMK